MFCLVLTGYQAIGWGASSTATLRIIDWNISVNGTGTDGVQDINRVYNMVRAKAPDADLFTCNECYKATITDFANRLTRDTGVRWYAVTQFDVGSHNHSGVLSRFPFISQPILHSYSQPASMDDGPKTGGEVDIDIQGSTVHVIVTRLCYPCGDAVRKVQGSDLRTWAATFGEPRIILGDFNDRPTTSNISAMVGAYLDTYREAKKKGVATAYDDNPSGNTHGCGTLDYLFISRGSSLTIVNAEVPDVRIPPLSNPNPKVKDPPGCTDNYGVKPSDHTPLKAVLAVPIHGTLPPPPPPPPPPSGKVRYFPRAGKESRMLGGKFQGSNVSPISGFVDLASIQVTPPSGSWSEIALNTQYKYLRYLSPVNGYGNIAEVEFYNGSTKIVGTAMGTLGSWQSSGNDFKKALDGNTATFFDGPTASGVYVGVSKDVTPPTVSLSAPVSGASVGGVVTLTANALDDSGVAGVQFVLDGSILGGEITAAPFTYSWNSLGVANGSHTLSVTVRDLSNLTANSAPTLFTVSNLVTAKVRFMPRAGKEARMVGGKFQGSNTSETNGFVDLATLSLPPAPGVYSEIAIPTSYRYLRYLGPVNGFGNIAELEFYDHAQKLIGTPFGTAGSWGNSGNTFIKALDGSTTTFFDASVASQAYVGIDTLRQLAGSTDPQPLFEPSLLSAVVVYPNPWRSDRHADLPMTFRQVGTHSTIKIFTVSGHWVRTLASGVDPVTWDLRNNEGARVASGIYLYLIKDDSEKKTGVIAIIR